VKRAPRASAAVAGTVRAPRDLEALETWFQGELAAPHEGRKRAARADVARRVLPSRTLAPERRLEIYSSMYFARLHECLREDFPALFALLGQAGFEKLVRAYLTQHPSRHYSLNVLGRSLPKFLLGPVRIARRPMLADVARLEDAISRIFEAPQARSIGPEDVARLDPSVWNDAHPRLIPALELQAFDHRANAIVSAARHGKELPKLGRAKTWVVVYRKEWVVWRMDLREPMFHVLSALQRGRSLRRAILAGKRAFQGDPRELEAQVSTSFAEWIREGFFASIDGGAR
jgi:hypothetical protein